MALAVFLVPLDCSAAREFSATSKVMSTARA
jgi:hypothetical protein